MSTEPRSTAGSPSGAGNSGVNKSGVGKPGTAIRILLAEDQTMLRGALAALLDLEPDLSVIAQAANGREAFKLALQHNPEVVVTDIEMPGRTGLELASDLK